MQRFFEQQGHWMELKKLVCLAVTCLMRVSVSLDAEAARRLGGGRSLGRSAPTFVEKSTPQTQSIPRQAQERANARSQSTAPRQTPAQARPSMMRSVLTGLAAALGVSALLSLLGIHGQGIASLVTVLLLAVVCIMIFRTFAARRRPSPATPASGEPMNHSERVEMPSSSFSVPRQGSVLDELSKGAAGFAPKDITPSDFDRAGFLAAAKENYVKLQKAWCSGNVMEISEFTSDEIFTAITHQLRDRKGETFRYESGDLDADLLGIAEEGERYFASVRFWGWAIISGEREDIDEIWVLEKPVQGSGGWLLTAIRPSGTPA